MRKPLEMYNIYYMYYISAHWFTFQHAKECKKEKMLDLKSVKNN